MHKTSIFTLMLALPLGVGCSSPNQPPTLTVAATLSLREGDTIRTPIVTADPDGDAVDVTVSASADLVVELEPSAGNERELIVRGAYGSGEHRIVLRYTDRTTSLEQAIDVALGRMAWGTRWELGASGMPGREHPTTWLDEDRERILVVQGSGFAPQGTPLADAWQVSMKDGTASPVAMSGDVPDSFASQRIAIASGAKRGYLFGGYRAPPNTPYQVSNELRLVDFSGADLSFSLVTQENPPPERGLHALVHDVEGQRLILFGGFAPGGARDDLWVGDLVGDQVRWREITSGERPSPRYGFAYGQFDRKLFIYSGGQGTNPIDPARDLWSLDLAAKDPVFSRLAEGDAVPPGRRNGCFAMDEQRGRLFVFGGTASGASSLPDLWIYDARSGIGTWTQRDKSGAPPIRSSGSVIVDPRDGAAYFGFGNEKTAYTDLTRYAF